MTTSRGVLSCCHKILRRPSEKLTDLVEGSICALVVLIVPRVSSRVAVEGRQCRGWKIERRFQLLEGVTLDGKVQWRVLMSLANQNTYTSLQLASAVRSFWSLKLTLLVQPLLNFRVSQMTIAEVRIVDFTLLLQLRDRSLDCWAWESVR